MGASSIVTAIAEGDVQAINYFVAQKYVEALQGIATSDNGKLVMMPLEASSIIGAIGGIKELTSAALGSTKQGRIDP